MRKYNEQILVESEEAYLQLVKRNIELKILINEKRNKLQNASEEQIQVRVRGKNGNQTQYCYKRDKDSKWKYLPATNNEQLISKIVQKEYDEKILKIALDEQRYIEKLISHRKEKGFEKIYEKQNRGRKQWITPVILSDEEYVKEWESEIFSPMPFEEDASEIYTKKGERVRSKTERMIANTLYEHGIPYKYECPIIRNGKVISRPDFTVLNVRRRKQYYWEHFGMMDDMNYANGFVKKLATYEKNDIHPGENLISSYETSSITINEKDVEAIIEKYLV